MAEKTYTELLKDPRWQKKRLEILQRDAWTCQGCADESATLHVHHRKYIWGRKPWDYEDELLVTLCESCHQVTTAATERVKQAISRLHIIELDRVFGYATGLIAHLYGLGIAHGNPIGLFPPETLDDPNVAHGVGEALGLSRDDLKQVHAESGLSVASVLAEADRQRKAR